MKKGKVTALLLAAGMVMSTLAGCGSSEDAAKESQKESTVASSESKEEVKEESSEAQPEGFDPKSVTEGVKLTIAVKENDKVADYNTNEMTMKLEETLGVDLEFVTYAAADYETKLNVMVMSGSELPDIIFDPGNQYAGWAEEGAIISLNEYYENPDMSSYFWAANDKLNSDITGSLKNAEGDMYFLPRYSESISGAVQTKLWVYEPWLEAIGKDVPETTEEFYEVCKLIAENDLNGNGKKDEIALTGYGFSTGGNRGWFSCLMSAFIYAHDSKFMVADDGQLSFAYMTEEWKEGLKYIKQFFDDGLIPVETLTQDNAQYESVWKGDELRLFSFAFYHMGGTDLNRKVNYTHIPALKGPNGVQYARYQPSKPAAGAVITADCENPDAAFLVLDYMYDEEMSITNRYGKRGENWDYWEEATVEDKNAYAANFPENDIFWIAYDDAAFFSSDVVQNAAFFQSGPQIVGAYVLNNQAVLQETTTEEEALNKEFEDRKNTAIQDCLKYSPEEVITNLPMTAEEQNEIIDMEVSLNTYLNEITCQFLVGEKDIDAEWNAYLAELEKIGCNQLLETYQTAYDRTK